MLENDLDLLRNAAILAGKIAMRFYQKNPTYWDKGDGQGPVSEADLEIDKMLFESKCSLCPDHADLSVCVGIHNFNHTYVAPYKALLPGPAMYLFVVLISLLHLL